MVFLAMKTALDDRVNVALPRLVHTLLKERCERDDTNLTKVLRRIVLDWLQRTRVPKARAGRRA